VAEILVIALAHLVDFFLEVICGSARWLAVAFVALPPVLELVVSGTVVGSFTLAALE
jgi:hypothetical protein